MTKNQNNAEFETDNPEETGTPVNYIATYGDWVRTHEDKPATVIYAQPFYAPATKTGGETYTLMYPGGTEKTFHHHDGADHLIPVAFVGENRDPVPLFTVVTPTN